MSTAGLPDRDARVRAVTDFETNLVVVAGAGTGKTSLLVERVLNALGSGKLSVERLWAMTFTEKAAGEMQQRLATRLERLVRLARNETEPRTDEADRSWAWLRGVAGIPAERIERHAARALEGLDRATITTIHGVCVEMLRDHAVAAGVDPDFVVDSGEKAELLRRQVWDEFLSSELGPRATRPELWRRVLRAIDLGDVAATAEALADFAIPDAALTPPFSRPTARVLFGAEIDPWIEGLAALVRDQSGLGAPALDYFRRALEHLERLRDEGHEAFRAALACDPDFEDRLRGNRIPRGFKRLSGFDADLARRLAVDTRRFLLAMGTIDDALIESLLELLGPYVGRFREAMLRQGLISFDGLLVLARDLLRDRPEIRRRIKRRFDVLLVDEFQDTDPVQYEIVLFLAEDVDGNASEATNASLAPGGLFVVGDEKQSIYRFRGADFAAYRRTVDHILAQGGERLELSANFRSVPGIVEPVNRLFEEAADGLWRPSPHQPSYRPIRSTKNGSGEPSTEIWTLELDRASTAELRRAAEGELIAERIDRLVRESDTRHGEITVLFRAFTSLAPYLRPLRQRRIPFVVDGGRDFLERPEVVQTIAAIRALAQPADPVALLAFLRSPAGGVSDRELALYGAEKGRWSYRSEPDTERYPTIARRFRLLRELERETRALSADAVVRRVIERTGLVPLNAAAFEGPQRVANLRKIVDTAGSMARDGRLSLLDVAEALESTRLGELDSEAPLADDSIDAVRISSIHRMKGLENRWIILPDLARMQQLDRWEPVSVGLVRPRGEPAVALSVKESANSAAVWRRREDRLHEEAEETRLLYVALTRATERLVVVAGPTRWEAPWLEALRPWGFDADTPPADGAILCEGHVVHRSFAVPQSGGGLEPYLHQSADRAVARFATALERMTADAAPIAPSRMVDQSRDPTAGRDRRGDGTARVVGIVVHRLLERRGGEDRAATHALALALCRETAEAEQTDVVAVEREVRTLVDTLFDSGLAERLDRIDAVGRELPIVMQADDGGVIRGTIDLLYRGADGRLVVADFKTDRETDPARLVATYGPQIDLYAEAVRRATATLLPPARELWALRSGEVVRLPEEDA